MRITTDPTVLLVGLLTLAVYTWAWKQNPLYRFVESLFVGLGAGYGLTVAVVNLRNAGWLPLVAGNYVRILPLILAGMLVAAVQWPRLRSFPMSFIIGTGTGLALRVVMQTQFLRQIQATWLPLNSVNNLILIVGTVASLSFFFFTIAARGTGVSGQLMGFARTVGAATLMACFGASFATAVQARLSTFVARMQWLFSEFFIIN